jgi:hypothetical protein
MHDRYTLANGDWIDLTTVLNHAQMRRLRAARGTDEVAAEGVAAMAVAWAIRDVDGQPIEFPGAGVDGVPVAALDRFPEPVFVEIAERAADILNAEPDPNATPLRSDGQSQGSQSQPSPTLPTPISSPITQDGPGPISQLPQTA